MNSAEGNMARRWAGVLCEGLFIGGIDAEPKQVPTEKNKMYRPKRMVTKKIRKQYRVHGTWGRAQLTRREAECMLWILRGYTNQQIGEAMTLSARTVEYYIKNMRRKVGAYTKLQLMHMIDTAAFLNEIDFL